MSDGNLRSLLCHLRQLESDCALRKTILGMAIVEAAQRWMKQVRKNNL